MEPIKPPELKSGQFFSALLDMGMPHDRITNLTEENCSWLMINLASKHSHPMYDGVMGRLLDKWKKKGHERRKSNKDARTRPAA